MEFADAFRTIIKSRGYTQQALANEVGVKLGSLTNVIRRNNPTVDGISKYLRALGYDVALVPVGSRLPEGSYVLEPSKDDAS